MSDLNERISRLKGMAGAMKLNMDEDSSRLMLEMLHVMGEMADEIQRLSDAHNELNEYVETIDDDLADLAESVLDEEAGMLADLFAQEEGDDEDDDEDMPEEEDLISYACPTCGHMIQFDPSSVDFDEDYRCPKCGNPIFPELTEDE